MSTAVVDTKSKMSDFKKAHFFIGFDQSKTNTNYQEDYIQREKPQEKLPDTQEAKQFEAYIKNPRKAHFEIGEDKVNYDSIQKLSYDQKNGQKAQLTDETMKDLRSHHFKLGFHSVPLQTEYQDYQPKKSEKQDILIQSRKHHHEFGDLNTYFKTTYNTINQPHPVQKFETPGYVHEIRKSSIKMGDGLNQYQTHYNTYHQGLQNAKKSDSKELDRFLKESHLVMGEAQSVRLSQTKDIYKGEQQEQTKIAKKTLDDLRTAHFDLAYQKDDIPKSTSQSMFQKMAINISQPQFTKNSLQLGAYGFENDRYFESDYNGTYRNHNQQKPELMKDPRIQSVKFGDEQVQYKTESARNYQQYDKFQSSKLNKERLDEIRNSHFDLGNEGPQYPQKKQFKAAEENKLSDDVIKDLRKEHFVTGFQEQTFIPHSNEYGTKQGPPNKLNKELQDNLRKHHYYEECEPNFETSYQAQQQQLKKLK